MEEKTMNLLCTAEEMDLVKTFECGQCFRWNSSADDEYIGVAHGRAVKIIKSENNIYIDAPKEDLPLWREYFDLEADYIRLSEGFGVSEYMKTCMDFGMGIRILRQDMWEALCSFIISQCNNIPRIKKIVNTLCENFGEEILYQGEKFYSFPTAEKIATLEVSDLAPLRAGYRAEYIIEGAKAVSTGTVSYKMLSEQSHAEALKSIRAVKGVGEKVANCFILFGLHKMEAFPVDVWMKRALKEHFPTNFDPKTFGEYAGLAQQYIFYYARSGDK